MSEIKKEKTIFEIDKNMKENTSNIIDGIKYYDLNNRRIMGNAIHENYNRISESISVSENVDILKKQPAGFNICFTTNSDRIFVKAKLVGAAYMSHMTAVGTIGFSLYVNDNGKWVFLSTTKVNKNEYCVQMMKEMDKKYHEFRLYFPLYQGLIESYVGINEESDFEFFELPQQKIVIYGTSISQGGCATRPGMDYGSILGRMTNTNVINLGFSGSCKIEKEIVHVINEIKDKKVLILELEANAPSPSWMEERLDYFFDNLEDKEKFSIYLISHFDERMGVVNTGYKDYRTYFYNEQKRMAEKYGINFLDGHKLLEGLDADGLVDEAHLSDLGFYVLAKNLKEIISKDLD